MQKLMFARVASLACAGSAGAGLEGHADVDAAGESHTVDLWVNDDGTYSLLVDGAPLAVPEAPGAPELPPTPELPAPEVPSPEVPSVPELPTLP